MPLVHRRDWQSFFPSSFKFIYVRFWTKCYNIKRKWKLTCWELQARTRDQYGPIHSSSCCHTTLGSVLLGSAAAEETAARCPPIPSNARFLFECLLYAKHWSKALGIVYEESEKAPLLMEHTCCLWTGVTELASWWCQYWVSVLVSDAGPVCGHQQITARPSVSPALRKGEIQCLF